MLTALGWLGVWWAFAVRLIVPAIQGVAVELGRHVVALRAGGLLKILVGAGDRAVVLAPGETRCKRVQVVQIVEVQLVVVQRVTAGQGNLQRQQATNSKTWPSQPS